MDCRTKFYSSAVFLGKGQRWFFSLKDPIFLVFFEFSEAYSS